MPTLAEIIDGPGAWPDDTALHDLETYVPTSTLDPTPRAVAVDWTVAHGPDEVEPDPPTLRRLRELFDGAYAFKGPNQLHSQNHVFVEWVTPEDGEMHPGLLPTNWILVNE